MMIRTKTAAVLGAAVLGWTVIGTAGSAAAVTYVCGSVTSASWGQGQYCKGDNGSWRIRVRDTATDGYCVEAYRKHTDTQEWVRPVPRVQDCDAVWKTVITNSNLSDGVRVVRADGRYVTLDAP